MHCPHCVARRNIGTVKPCACEISRIMKHRLLPFAIDICGSRCAILPVSTSRFHTPSPYGEPSRFPPYDYITLGQRDCPSVWINLPLHNGQSHPDAHRRQKRRCDIAVHHRYVCFSRYYSTSDTATSRVALSVHLRLDPRL